MFGQSARFEPSKTKYFPGPGSYSPDLQFSELLPSRRPSTTQVPKPGVGVSRYNYLNNNLMGEVLILRPGQNTRLGPGCYPGAATVNPIAKKSHNILALDSMRKRSRLLTPDSPMDPPPKPAKEPRPEAVSLIRRAQHLLANIKGAQ